jgi:hypothetical protein
MTRPKPGRRRQRGGIDELPSGALRVRVYAGEDPLTGKRHSLIEIIPPGPKAAKLAEAARTRTLWMRVRGWEREKPWSPRYVGNELAGTRQADLVV